MSGIGGFKPNITPTERNIAKSAGIGALAGGAALGPAGVIAGAAAGAAFEAVKEISKRDTSNINKLNVSKTPVNNVSFNLDNKVENKSSKPSDTIKNTPITLQSIEKHVEDTLKNGIKDAIKGFRELFN